VICFAHERIARDARQSFRELDPENDADDNGGFMNRVTLLAAGAMLCIVVARRGTAQAVSDRHASIFRAPTFVFQPGLETSNFVDTPNGTSTSTKFNFRVVTAIPTTIPRTTLVGIVQWTPWNTSAGFNTNAPSFVYGPVFSLFNRPVVALDFDILGSYGPAAKSTDESSYTHKLVLEGDLSLKAGALMTDDVQSPWHSLALYGFLANVATGLPSGSSRWVVLYGISLPIAP
jgi:hypothetical protein